MRIERRLRLARALDAYELEVWMVVHQVASELAQLLRGVAPLARSFAGIRELSVHAIGTRRQELLRWERLLANPTELPERDTQGWFDRGSALSGG